MFSRFTLCLSFFIVIAFYTEKYDFQSGAQEIPDLRLGMALRQERIEARVCEDEQTDDESEEWDLCFGNDLISSTSLQSLDNRVRSVAKETHCMCDIDCPLYGDCCVDQLSEDWMTGNDFQMNMSCIELISGSVVVDAVYGVDKCDEDWAQTTGLNERLEIREKCELNAIEFRIMGKPYSYLQDIPVMSRSTDIMYKNIFCAVCNTDSSDLKTWNISMECKGFQINEILRHQKNNVKPEDYEPFVKKWTVMTVENKSINCSLAVQEFIDKDILRSNFRKCKKTITNCGQHWTDREISRKCRSYASYVYENNKVYKNYHCALCNAIHMPYVSCFPNTSVTARDWSERTVWFPLLLDFNFAGDSGQWIGGQQKCPTSGQLYDPLYDKCVHIVCNDKPYDNEREECVDVVRSENMRTSQCSAVLLLDNETDFVFLQNNSIYINKTDSLVEEGNYEIAIEENNMKVKICRNKSELISDSLIQSPFNATLGQTILSEISLFISIICLTLHLIVYALLPKLRNLPGKSLICLSSSLLLAHISFIMASHLTADRRILCVLIAITTHYTYLASVFWMSVMAFDVCKTFRRTSRRSSKSSNRYKFLKYSLYAWLSPAFIVLLSTAFDIGLKDSKFQPLYGYRFCWISQRHALLVFFVLPMAALVGINTLCFCITAKGLIKTEEQTKILKKKSDRVRYFLYIKLAVIMGLTWIFGFMAALSHLSILWYPFIVLNGLQGTVIFIAFTCKRKVWMLLRERFGFSREYQSSTATSPVIRSVTRSTSVHSSTLVPNSPNSNVTKINFTK